MYKKDRSKKDSTDTPTALAVALAPGLAPTSVGAKAANLAKAMEAGFDAPPGFVVTRQGLQLFLTENLLLAPVEAWLEDSASQNATDGDAALCQQVAAAPLPAALKAAVDPLVSALLAQAPHGLAVRSSGLYEDSANASFAGVYESYLGIRTMADFWDAVRRCWSAAWSPDALTYTRRMGIDPQPDPMAVLVQPLLPADSAGVLFTADPQTGNPWRFALESTFGLAQDLVGSAGGLPVDRFVFKWDSGRILDRRIAAKETVCTPGPTGIERAALAKERQSDPSLSDADAGRIAQLGLDLDRLFGRRVDVEWVLTSGQIHIVQVRPITALPTFFPHHLPQHAADKTWRLAPLWHFAYRRQGPLMSPIYRDLLISEKHSRYLQVGPFELPPHLRAGGEMDFNGYRYMPEQDWPEYPLDWHEAYLETHEPVLRRDYLDALQKRYPAMAAEAVRRQQEARSPAAWIEALLWARDGVFDMYSITAGPSQSMFGTSISLLRRFMAQYAPERDTDGLLQGHHPALDPYYPQVQVVEAERLAARVGPERPLFDRMEAEALLDHLLGQGLDSAFMQALADYGRRYGLVPPGQLTADGNGRDKYHLILQLVRGALKGQSNVARRQAEAAARQDQETAAVRRILAADAPEQMQCFERLLDWARFWGPALNNRAWIGVYGSPLGALWRTACSRLQEAGLIDDSEDIDYFTAEDLAHIAATGDIEAGRRTWQRRRHEYERDARLVAPDYLGKPPEEHTPVEPASEVSQADDETPKESAAQPRATTGGIVIQGQAGVPGRASGAALKIESLSEADHAGPEHVLVFAQPLQPSSATTPLLFSLVLRVQAVVSPKGPLMWMHHIGQVARECGVPVVQIAPADIERIAEGAALVVDGSKGTVTIGAVTIGAVPIGADKA